MIYLDTHVVVWLFAGRKRVFSQGIRELINLNELVISPIVRLELQFLFEIDRISDEPDTIVADLSNRIGLQLDDKAFDVIVTEAMRMSWTRDPFDRIIVATASLNDEILVTKDRVIRANYSFAKW